jgi:hypothetical protein
MIFQRNCEMSYINYDEERENKKINIRGIPKFRLENHMYHWDDPDETNLMTLRKVTNSYWIVLHLPHKDGGWLICLWWKCSLLRLLLVIFVVLLDSSCHDFYDGTSDIIIWASYASRASFLFFSLSPLSL